MPDDQREGLTRIDQELVRLLTQRQLHVDRLADEGALEPERTPDPEALRDRALLMGMDTEAFDTLWPAVEQVYAASARRRYAHQRTRP